MWSNPSVVPTSRMPMVAAVPALSILAACALASVLSPTPAAAALGDVMHSIPCAGPNTSDLAWVNGKIYQVIFAPTDLKGIYVVDAASGAVLDRLTPAGSSPQGLTYDGHNLWQSDVSGDALYKLDPETAAIRDQWPAPGGVDGQPLGLGWDGENLWLADSRGPEKIWLVDSVGTALGQIPAPGASPYGLAWAEGYVWVSDNNMTGVAAIYQLDPDDGSVVASFPCPGGGGAPNGITHDGQDLWIADNTTDQIYQVDDGIVSGAVAEGRDALRPRLRVAMVSGPGPEIRLRVSLERAARLEARVFDIRGCMVVPEAEKEGVDGDQELRLRTDGVPSGVYLVQVEALGEKRVARLILVR